MGKDVGEQRVRGAGKFLGHNAWNGRRWLRGRVDKIWDQTHGTRLKFVPNPLRELPGHCVADLGPPPKWMC